MDDGREQNRFCYGDLQCSPVHYQSEIASWTYVKQSVDLILEYTIEWRSFYGGR
jgi:hypothetical protein